MTALRQLLCVPIVFALNVAGGLAFLTGQTVLCSHISRALTAVEDWSTYLAP